MFAKARSMFRRNHPTACPDIVDGSPGEIQLGGLPRHRPGDEFVDRLYPWTCLSGTCVKGHPIPGRVFWFLAVPCSSGAVPCNLGGPLQSRRGSPRALLTLSPASLGGLEPSPSSLTCQAGSEVSGSSREGSRRSAALVEVLAQNVVA